MNEEMKRCELNDDALNDVSGGVAVRGFFTSYSNSPVDVNQSGCTRYRCRICGGTRGAHAAGCTAGRPDCCGSCACTENRNGDLICSDIAYGK